jgi:hypothetical protein
MLEEVNRDGTGTRMRTRTAIAIAAVVLLGALSAGCGGNGGSEFGAGLTAVDVARALKAQGLPIGQVTAYTAATDPNHLLGRPHSYTSKVNFRDTRIKNPADPTSTDAGGSVEVCSSTHDAKSRADYVRGFTQSSAMFAEYNYLRGRVFLRVSADLTPKQAHQYEEALSQLKNQPRSSSQ